MGSIFTVSSAVHVFIVYNFLILILTGLQDLDLEWSKLDEKEERKGVSFLGNLLAQQSKMLKGFKKSPAPAACPAPKVRQFRGERRSSRRKSMVFFPEAADIVQEKQGM